MTLLALLSAQVPAVEGDADAQLAALLPVAGMTLIERQAQAAAAAGAKRALVLVDALPSALSAALDRIRARGLAIDMVRDAAGVIAAAADAQRVMLVADGLMAPTATWATLAAASVPTLLAVADAPATAQLERIDAARRWAGLAIISAGGLAALTDLPEDWDPQLALLRAAIQGQAATIACEPQLFELGDIIVVETAAAAELVELRLLAVGTQDAVGLVHAGLLMPLARSAVRPLLRGHQGGVVARIGQIMGGGGALAAMAAGYPAIAIGLALFCAVTGAAAGAIAAFRPELPFWQRIGESGGLMALAGLVAAGGQVGGEGLFVGVCLGLVLILIERLGMLLARHGVVDRRWVIDGPAIWVVLGIAQIGGMLIAGLAVAAPVTAAMLLFTVWRAGKADAV
jgi:hypothetical protein